VTNSLLQTNVFNNFHMPEITTEKKTITVFANQLVDKVMLNSYISVDLAGVGFDGDEGSLEVRVREVLRRRGMKPEYKVKIRDGNLIILQRALGNDELVTQAMNTGGQIVTSKHFTIDAHSSILIRAFTDLLRAEIIESVKVGGLAASDMKAVYKKFLSDIDVEAGGDKVMLVKTETPSVDENAEGFKR